MSQRTILPLEFDNHTECFCKQANHKLDKNFNTTILKEGISRRDVPTHKDLSTESSSSPESMIA